jgi:hypothetical protein
MNLHKVGENYSLETRYRSNEGVDNKIAALVERLSSASSFDTCALYDNCTGYCCYVPTISATDIFLFSIFGISFLHLFPLAGKILMVRQQQTFY